MVHFLPFLVQAAVPFPLPHVPHEHTQRCHNFWLPQHLSDVLYILIPLPSQGQ